MDNRIDLLWILVCTGQVLLMQAGFCMLESGMSRAKNSINVAAKNLADFCIACLCFWTVGFGLMYGTSMNGLFGMPSSMLAGTLNTELLSFFLFQMVFCGTAITIVSGASAERLKFRGYLIVCLLVSSVIYPVCGHWVWGGALDAGPSGWLEKLGFVDFAGSTVVHGVGAWVSLAVILVVGPRLGRFSDKRKQIVGSSLPSAVVGVIVLWFGWLGFNGGSTLALDESVAGILVNTCLAAAAGGGTPLCISVLRSCQLDIGPTINGVVSGLVAITACCHAVTPNSAIVIGTTAGLLGLGCTHALERLHIDDVIGAIPSHGIAGIWGTLCFALFASPELMPAGPDRFTQFGIQSLGVLTVFGWSFGVSFIALSIFNYAFGLRVSRFDEYRGLNITEHGASTELVSLLDSMVDHRRHGRFERPVHEEPFTEVGQIAAAYNRVLDRIKLEMNHRQQAEARYRELYENCVEGIYQTNLDGQFLNANAAMVDLLGYQNLKHLRSQQDNFASDLYVDPAKRECFLDRLFVNGFVSDFRSQVRRGDDEITWISETARLIRDESGQPSVIEGIAIDVTQRMTSENLQLEKERAEAESEAKSRFLASMSHEMRTPLNGIISMLDLARGADDPKQRDRFLRIASQSSGNLLELINDVLDLSKLEAGKIVLEKIPYSVRDVIDESVEMLFHRAREKGLRLAAEVATDVPDSLFGDPGRIRQVIVNLLSNAIKFTDKGQIEVLVDQNASELDSPNLLFRVIDQGIGLPEDRSDKIFETFTQADASTTRRYGGTGLGLSICRQLTDAMNGRIGVESELGRGSTFWFCLPMEKLDGTETPSKAPLGTNGQDHSILSDVRVLMVASSHVESSAVFKHLRRWGAMVEWAKDSDSLSKCLDLRNSYKVLIAEESQLPLVQRIDDVAEIPHRLVLGNLNAASSFSAAIEEPVRESQLLDQIVALLCLDPSGDAVDETSTETSKVCFGDGRQVLIVDDNEVNRIVASELVRTLGFEPRSCANGPDAIELVRQIEVAAILMDCEMPGMDGLQTTQRIRTMHQDGKLAVNQGRPLPIVALTARVDAAYQQKCLSSGMDEYLCKPIERQRFTEVLADLMGTPDPCHAMNESGLAVHNISEDACGTQIEMQSVIARCGGNETAAHEVVQLFAKQVESEFKRLHSASVQGDNASVQSISHLIKGMAGNVSAKSIAQSSADLEACCRDGGLDQRTSDHVKELEASIDATLKWIQTSLGDAV